ncbi:unnamed protein product [Nippostrongylus brasiliensis]|uniref:Secreted protein n=1 Tax=Nippostrongylus brasiliensis TaxID=27835 RepID=A0A0N4Y4E6_NIPBR|nr:unnamed protein product [Nippostrongylus brasiliensis]
MYRHSICFPSWFFSCLWLSLALSTLRKLVCLKEDPEWKEAAARAPVAKEAAVRPPAKPVVLRVVLFLPRCRRSPLMLLTYTKKCLFPSFE